MVISQTKTWS